jgi:hypothetical protein
VSPLRTILDPADDAVGRIHDQLAHIANLRPQLPVWLVSGDVLSREQLATLIDIAFWASLLPNEGRPTRVRMVVGNPEISAEVLAFKEPLPYVEAGIAKLAPAVCETGYLALGLSDNGINIWGIATHSPPLSLNSISLEISDPGVVSVGVGRFQPFAVFSGRSTTFLQAPKSLNLAHYLQTILGKALPVEDILETHAAWQECFALVHLARMVMDEGHGGTLLLVPIDTDDWLQSLDPFTQRLANPDTTIHNFIRTALREQHEQVEAIIKLNKSNLSDEDKGAIVPAFPQLNWDPAFLLPPIARLAAVDGALVMTHDLRVLGFGAKISVLDQTPPEVFQFTPGRSPWTTRLEDLGGTRHQSGARFVAAHHDAIAIIISQDRRMSVAHWEKEAGAVIVLKHADWWG